MDSAQAPHVTPALVATTDEARRALGDIDALAITHLPFLIGRECRSFGTLAEKIERRIGLAPQLNDCYLIEENTPQFHISREHLAIERVQEKFFVVDRRSACGTRVNDSCVGGHRTWGRKELKDGDIITIGTSNSPYVYQFQLQPPPTGSRPDRVGEQERVS